VTLKALFPSSQETCHPERSNCFAQRSGCGVEGPLPTQFTPANAALWYVASAIVGVTGGYYAGAEAFDFVVDAGISAEATVPGATAATVDVLNVVSPTPTNVSTWAGVAAESYLMYQWYEGP